LATIRLEGGCVTYYGGKELAAAFETVRKNTILIAEDVPADKYDFRAAPGTMSVGEILAHIAVSTDWHEPVHSSGVALLTFEMFREGMAKAKADEQALRTKEDILKALRERGDAFARFLGGLSEQKLAERVSFPPPIQPDSKTRFEMLLGAKEHEMHHRGQLMLIERQLGIVPHLTRAREART
jgi:uncharacterized damage-inducible protein DinB